MKAMLCPANISQKTHLPMRSLSGRTLDMGSQ